MSIELAFPHYLLLLTRIAFLCFIDQYNTDACMETGPSFTIKDQTCLCVSALACRRDVRAVEDRAADGTERQRAADARTTEPGTSAWLTSARPTAVCVAVRAGEGAGTAAAGTERPCVGGRGHPSNLVAMTSRRAQFRLLDPESERPKFANFCLAYLFVLRASHPSYWASHHFYFLTVGERLPSNFKHG